MEKNYTLNFVKFIAAIMVILIHIKFPGDFGLYISSLARFAVPFFFMISGYYSYKGDDTALHLKKHIKKIFILSIITTVIYFAIYTLYHYILGNYDFYDELFTLDNLKYFIILNNNPYARHLWYLYALLYVYIVYYLFHKYRKYLYYLIPFLLTFNVIFECFIAMDIVNYEHFVVRNFLFTGLPFFMIGLLINQYRNKFIKLFNNRILGLILLVSSITSIIEVSYFSYMNLHFSTIPLSIAIFILCINNPNIIKSNNLFSKYGEKYSLGIYISHIFVKLCFNIFIIKFGIADNIILEWFTPILIIALTMLIVVCYYNLKFLIRKGD